MFGVAAQDCDVNIMFGFEFFQFYVLWWEDSFNLESIHMIIPNFPFGLFRFFSILS
jgi:hypothetical protein